MKWRQILKILLIVSIFYLPPSVYLIRNIIEKLNYSEVTKTVAEFKYLNDLINLKTKEQQYTQICSTLEILAEKNQIGFKLNSNLFAFQIENNDINCGYHVEVIQKMDSQLSLNRYSDFKSEDSGTLTYFKTKNENASWTIGLRTIPLLSFWNHLKTNSEFRGEFLIDLLLFLYTIIAYTFLTTYLIRKSILSVVRSKSEIAPLYPRLNKVLTFVQDDQLQEYRKLFLVYVRHNDNLRTMLDRSSGSLNATILKKIQDENLILPYHFNGTVVGVDINGFSKLTGKYNELAEVLTEKIIDMGMELVMRYGGLFSSVAGDEVVVVFDHEHQAMNKKYNLQMLGTAFARDLMRDYSNHVFHFLGSDHQFNLKAGIADSEITFKETKAGTIFGGEAFTFSKRLSSSVITENINAMAILAADIDHIKYLVTPEPLETFKFKNMGEHKGYQIRKFLNIESAYSDHPELLPYFRSDTDIVFLVTKICVETSIEKLNLIFKYLSEIKTYHVSESVINSWLNSVKNMYSNNKINNFNKNFARLIILGKNLLPQKQWSHSMTDAVLNIPRNIDGRINASVIELLVDKNLYETVVPISESFLIASDTSFRAKGELLIARATLELSETVLTEIIEMLQSYNKLQMASGIYVSGQILKYYEEKNPAGLRTYSAYKKIMWELKQIHLKKSDQLSDRMKTVLLAILQ